MYKHSLNCRGHSLTRAKFAEELRNLGYKPTYGADTSECTHVCTNKHTNRESILRNGFYAYMSAPYARQYSFDIDNKWEFKAALGVAAMRDDEEYYPGEYIIWEGHELYRNKGCMMRIEKVEGNLYSYKEFTNEVVQNKYTYSKSFIRGSACHSMVRKATPEEIIKFCKEQVYGLMDKFILTPLNTNKKMKKEKVKEIIAYKVKKSFPGVLVGTVFPIATADVSLFAPDHFDDTEFFEPVYKEEEFENGDYLIAEGDDEVMYAQIDLKKGDMIRIHEWGSDWKYEIPGNPDSRSMKYFSKRDKGDGFSNSFRKATLKEIEENLILAAKKRGFKEGLQFTAVRDTVIDDWGSGKTAEPRSKQKATHGGYYTYNPEKDCLATYSYGVSIIYEKGVWASIVPPEKSIIIGSRHTRVTIGRGYIKIGRMSTQNPIIKEVKELYEKATIFDSRMTLAAYNVYLCKTARFIRIGCIEQNNLFSVNELKEVIDAYEELNK